MKYPSYIRSLKPEHVGQRISCKIGSRTITDAKIQKQDSTYFICQNVVMGASCRNKLGYKYSYTVDCGTMRDLTNESVSKIVLLDESKAIDSVAEMSKEAGYKQIKLVGNFSMIKVTQIKE